MSILAVEITCGDVVIDNLGANISLRIGEETIYVNSDELINLKEALNAYARAIHKGKE